MARLGKDKGKAGSSAAVPPSQGVMPPTDPATHVVAPSGLASVKPAEGGPIRAAAPAPRSHWEDPRPRDIPTSGDELARQKSAHRALVSKFWEKLTLKVAESSKRPDPIATFGDCTDKMIEVSCNLFGLLGLTVYCLI